MSLDDIRTKSKKLLAQKIILQYSRSMHMQYIIHLPLRKLLKKSHIFHP